MTRLILLLGMFLHGQHKPKPEYTKQQVVNFAHNTTIKLDTYKVGGVEQWLIQDRITEIEQDVDYLVRNPQSPSDGDMMRVIVVEMQDLYDYDNEVQDSIKKNKVVERQA